MTVFNVRFGITPNDVCRAIAFIWVVEIIADVYVRNNNDDDDKTTFLFLFVLVLSQHDAITTPEILRLGSSGVDARRALAARRHVAAARQLARRIVILVN